MFSSAVSCPVQGALVSSSCLTAAVASAMLLLLVCVCEVLGDRRHLVDYMSTMKLLAFSCINIDANLVGLIAFNNFVGENLDSQPIHQEY